MARDESVLFESARFVALEREAERLMDEAVRLAEAAVDADEAGDVAEVGRLVDLGTAAIREARKCREAMA